MVTDLQRCVVPGHPPHLRQRMECVACAYAWVDCPGQWGARYRSDDPSKQGCPACLSIYWRAETIQ